MTEITFQLSYVSFNGETLRLAIQEKSTENITIHPLMHHGDIWTTTLHCDTLPTNTIYRYEVCIGNKIIRTECGWPHRLITQKTNCIIIDQWSSFTAELFRSPFVHCIYSPNRYKDPIKEVTGLCSIHLHSLPTNLDKEWIIVGASNHLGHWDIARGLPLTHTDVYEWTAILKNEDLGQEYKFVQRSKQNPNEGIWEKGFNRILPTSNISTHIHIFDVEFDAALWRGAGIVLPIFALKSNKSFGVGDFGDLKRLIEWSASVGMQAVQTLPVNDTTRSGYETDSYPYSAISVFALHPIYIDASEWDDTRAYSVCKKQGTELNKKPKVDYEKALALKFEFLILLFAEIGKKILRRKDFCNFCHTNEKWLTPYVNYCVHRDYTLLNKGRKAPFVSHIAPLTPRKRNDFYKFTQYLLHHQLTDAHTYAQQKGIILKGDIPIGVAPDSVSVVEHPQLFHTDASAGAPPDFFSRDGQNWGFPTYNWEAMEKDNYAWWKARIENMQTYFDAYRIDHVLGFFRIWEIPNTQRSGMLGHFRPALPLTEKEIIDHNFKSPIALGATPHLTKEEYKEFEHQWYPHNVEKYFVCKNELYFLHPNYRTQADLLSRLTVSDFRQAMLEICTNVLWIVDSDFPHMFHPRIMGRDTLQYKRLTAEEQQAYDIISNDFFFHRHNEFWKKEALKKLPAVASEKQPMLPCAEDLGMVPNCVPEVLKQLHIATLQIETMPKTNGCRFDDTRKYPYLSVATFATHDMAPMRLWWQEDRQAAQQYWNERLHHDGPAPQQLPTNDALRIVRNHLESPSMLCLLSFQDWTAIDSTMHAPHPKAERINDPANPNQIWNYRMHLTIENLKASKQFNLHLTQLLHDTHRQHPTYTASYRK